MNAFFAAGLFDNPWIVAVVVIGGAIANWVAKRRQEKQARHQSEGDKPSPSTSKPPGEFNLEETLRRLLGEEPPLPPPAPPRIPRPAQPALPPAQIRSENEPRPSVWTRINQTEATLETVRQPAKPTAPVSRPPIVLAPVGVASRAASQQAEQATRHFELLNEQGRHPATVVSHTRPRLWRSGRRGVARWREVRSVRRAFVASLVFAPPKSFEP